MDQKKRAAVSCAAVMCLIALGARAASAQSSVPPAVVTAPAAASDRAPGLQQGPAQGLQDSVSDVVDRFHIGAYGGIALDPELITFGAVGSFGPIFSPAIAFRPGVYFSFGEITTELGFDLDVVYTIPGTRGNTWRTYVGGGPNFALSHKGFEEPADSEEGDSSTTTTTNPDGTTVTTETPSRFDFSDTNFDVGFNFIVGARRTNGVFFEMKATAYGVSNVKLLVGFRF